MAPDTVLDINKTKLIVNTKVNKDLFTGINRVKSYFKNNKIFIFNNCVNLIREIKAYRWGTDDAPVKADDHALDELRYYIMTRPHNEQPKTEQTAVQKDKNKLIRNLMRKRRGVL